MSRSLPLNNDWLQAISCFCSPSQSSLPQCLMLTPAFPGLNPGSPPQLRECSTPGCRRLLCIIQLLQLCQPQSQQGGGAAGGGPAAKAASNSSYCLACLELTKNLWRREEQSTVVPTHSPIITPCFTSSIICLDTQCHAASCDHRELAVPLLENFPFSPLRYF